MSLIKVIAGDFPKGNYEVTNVLFSHDIVVRKPQSIETLDLKNRLERVEIHTEESVKKLSGTAGWGIAGAVVLGPLGAIGGMLIGGRSKEICFAAYFKDGKKLLGVTDGKTYQKIAAMAFS